MLPSGDEQLDAELDSAPESAPPSTISPSAYRITPMMPGSIPPRADTEVVEAITDLLLAAASADGEVCRRELKAIRKLICQLLGAPGLPEWVEQRIRDFDFNKFDLGESTKTLATLPIAEKRHVLELARRVCDANNAYDLEEERYILSLVFALELSTEEAADLVLEASPSLLGATKRLFDVLFSATFLLFAWPLLLVLGLLVKLSSPGPALFIQRRYGCNGREIRIWKFRSMRATAEDSAVKQATQGDPRVTRLGAFMRRTSLDELPQFINVFLGEMSVVGPRPHAIAHNQFYRTQILEYMLRHKVKPGITGLAQVNGWRGETNTLDKMVQRVAFDLKYIQRHTLWLDILIVFRTVFGGSSKRNAY